MRENVYFGIQTRTVFSKSCLLLSILVSSVLLSFAGKPAFGPAPAWLIPFQPDQAKAVDSKEISDGFFYQLIELQKHVPLKADYRHYTWKMVNETGVQNNSEIAVEYDPAYETVIFHFVHIIRNGSIVGKTTAADIRVKEVNNEEEYFLYSDLKKALIILENTQVGDIIDCAYTVVGRNPVFGDNFTCKQFFCRSTPVQHFFFGVLYDPAKPLYLHETNTPPSPVKANWKQWQSFQWTDPVLVPWKETRNAPGWFDQNPSVSLTSFSDWEEVRQWAKQAFRNYNYPLQKQIKDLCKQWIKTANGDTGQYIIRAIRFVQDNIRYLGMEDGVHTHQPHDPNIIFKQGYGDCKDKALLLARLLQEAGVEAYAALVNTQLGSAVAETAPSYTVFNHSIVAIKNGGRLVFVDPTMNNQRSKLNNFYIPAYGKALLIDSVHKGFTAIGAPEYATVEITQNLKIRYPGDGISTLNICSVFRNGRADIIRDYFASNSISDIQTSYTDYYQSIYDSIRMQSDIKMEDDTISNVITVWEAYDIPYIWQPQKDGKKSIDLFAKEVFERLIDPADQAAGTPIRLYYPTDIHLKMNVDLPEAWNFNYKEEKIDNNYLQYSFKPVVAGNLIRLNYSLRINKDHVAAEYLSSYKADYEKMDGTLAFNLSKPGINSGYTIGTANKLHIPSLVLILMTISGAALFLAKHNKATPKFRYETGNSHGFTGWTVFLGIVLLGTVARQSITVFSNEGWKQGFMQGLLNDGRLGFYYAVFFEMAVEAVLLAMSVAQLIWFYRKRDIFPRFFLFFLGFQLAVFFVSLGLTSLFDLGKYIDNYDRQQVTDIFRIVIWSVACGSYVIRSVNVKETFVRPYTTSPSRS